MYVNMYGVNVCFYLDKSTVTCRSGLASGVMRFRNIIRLVTRTCMMINRIGLDLSIEEVEMKCPRQDMARGRKGK